MKTRMNINKNKGFSVIEMVMVFIIISLFIGAFLSGQDMIRAAKVRAVISQVHSYEVAINAFKTKYHGLPGDMNNAQSYWPTQCVDDGSNHCNGDMNGEIYPSTSEGLR